MAGWLAGEIEIKAISAPLEIEFWLSFAMKIKGVEGKQLHKRVFEWAVEFDRYNLFFRPSGGRNGDAFFRLIETKSRYEMRQ